MRQVTSYYNPSWGRFINGDALVGRSGELLSHNMFAYCKNNPVNMSDPSGEWWIFAGAVIGAVVGIVTQVAYNAGTGSNLTDNVVGAALGGAVSGAILAATFGTGVVTASFAGAAVTSISNEVETYVRGKEVTKKNIVESSKSAVYSTVVAGTINVIGNSLAGKAIPTNPNWFIPTKFSSSFSGKYAKKVIGQTIIGGVVNDISGFIMNEIKKNKTEKYEPIRWDTSTVIKQAP